MHVLLRRQYTSLSLNFVVSAGRANETDILHSASTRNDQNCGWNGKGRQVKCNKLILYALWNANIRRRIAAINLMFFA